jgi:hypothetical protein
VAIVGGGLLVAAVLAAVSEDAGLVLLVIAVAGLIAFPLFYDIYYVGKDGQRGRGAGSASACSTRD